MIIITFKQYVMAYCIIACISISVKDTYMVKIYTCCKCLSRLKYNVHICPWTINESVLCGTICVRNSCTLHNLFENIWETKYCAYSICENNHLACNIVSIKAVLYTLQPWHTNTSNIGKTLIRSVEKWYSYIITQCFITNCDNILIIKHNCISIKWYIIRVCCTCYCKIYKCICCFIILSGKTVHIFTV